MDQITIKGTIYNVMSQTTPAQEATEGRVLTARQMRQNEVAVCYYVRKVRGSNVFIVTQNTAGQFSTLTKVF